MRTNRVSTLGVFLAALLLLQPLAARASDGLDLEGIDPSKVLDYVACGLAVATITTGVGAVAAALTCGKVLVDWWDK